jgi:hypothetical protein
MIIKKDKKVCKKKWRGGWIEAPANPGSNSCANGGNNNNNNGGGNNNNNNGGGNKLNLYDFADLTADV